VLMSVPDGIFSPRPSNFIVRSFVPQLALLRHVDGVVCHGGNNTVCEALAQGVPVVAAPSAGETPFVAEQLLNAGAGVRVSFHRPNADEIARAVEGILLDPKYKLAAQRIQAAFRSAGGAAAAVGYLSELVNA